MNVNKLIQEFLRDNRGYLVAYIMFMFAYPISSVYLPKYYGKIIDDLKNGNTPKFGVIVILLILSNSMFLFLDKLDTVFIPKLQAYIRINIVKAVLQNYKDKFQEQELGSLISQIVKFPIVVRDLVRQIRYYIVPVLLILLMIIARFTLIDRRIGMLVLAGIFATLVVLTPMVKQCLEISTDMDNNSDNVHENISELFDNMLDIYSMDTCDKEMQNLENRQEDMIRRYQKTFVCTNRLRGVMSTMGITIFISAMIYSYKLYQHMQIDLPNLLNVVVTGMHVIGKIGSLSGETPDIIFNIGTYIRTQRYLSNMNLKPEIDDNFRVTDGELTFRDLSINYGDKKVIRNFNLVILPGESIAIIGKIGSGKSSIVKALLKLIPYSGHIYIDGKDIAELEPSTVRSQILYVSQNPIPFNRTLYENIVYGNDDVGKEQVLAMFGKYGLGDFFEHDLDDTVGKKGSKLSGGQRQMIFLLRILLSKTHIIVLDEPTSSLDDHTSKYVMRMLEEIMQERTVILITHDIRLGKIADRKIELQ